jgi:hypothetical protein
MAIKPLKPSEKVTLFPLICYCYGCKQRYEVESEADLVVSNDKLKQDSDKLRVWQESDRDGDSKLFLYLWCPVCKAEKGALIWPTGYMGQDSHAKYKLLREIYSWLQIK